MVRRFFLQVRQFDQNLDKESGLFSFPGPFSPNEWRLTPVNMPDRKVFILKILYARMLEAVALASAKRSIDTPASCSIVVHRFASGVFSFGAMR